ncbi:methyltransferase [Thalassobaculum fulvum]|uniref:Methyltransferase n=1 Tax=Thalassobaculum fulvum TaxID=1633335 RepID=A0A918XTU2_9PROT|nr:CmcJ/NvfI family oxidoreductase [Thalassobaculum fulvum]GHD53844.1 methyltransferase [Thalassobaculum fulvum]
MSVQTANRTTAANPGVSTRAPLAAIEAELTFITPSDTKPVFHSSALTGGAPRVLFETERHRVPIHDMRPIAYSLSLDREGFALLRRPTAVEDLYDDVAVETRYYAEIEALLKEALGAARVVIFDATRRSDAGPGAPNRDGSRGPASRVHVDYTAKSGPQRLRDVVGNDEADRLLAGGARVVQVNVWRPIRGPVERAPLALADASSVRPEDLIATDQVFPNRVGEIYHLAHEPGQRWYYAPWMTADEVLLIKGWDSLDDGRARFTPHGAFEQPDTPADAAPRESIEVRTLVIIEG